MCRNIKTLANFDPPATDDEIRASALQFVRKLSGVNSRSRANQRAFDRAVDEVSAAARRLISSLTTTAPLATGTLLASTLTSSCSVASSSMMAPRPRRSTWWTGMEVVPSTTVRSTETLSSLAKRTSPVGTSDAGTLAMVWLMHG